MDVRNDVAVGVGVVGLGPMGDISGKTLRGCQTGAFANQQYSHPGTQQIANFIENTDAAVMDHDGAAYCPVPLFGSFVEEGKQRRDLGGDGGNGEAVADRNLQIAAGWAVGADCVK